MDEIKVKSMDVFTPDPYFKITTGVLGYKGFYKIQSLLWKLWEESKIDDDFNNGYYTEECDYEGDLNRIIIHNSSDKNSHNSFDKLLPFFKLIFNYFGCDFVEVPKGMDIVFSEY